MSSVLETVLLVLVSIAVIIDSSFLLGRHQTSKKEKEDKKENYDNELVQYVFSAESAGIYTFVLNMVDNFIEEALQTYFKIQAYKEDHYINSEETKEMNSYLLASVANNMTPSVRHVISLVYNIRTDEELTNFLKLRIKLRMIEVLVNVNKTIQ